jgi:hypothetical protein
MFMRNRLKNLLLFEDYGASNYGALNRNTGNLAGKKEFTDEEIKYYQKLWDFLHVKHRNNKFFSNLWERAKNKKELSKRQWMELEFLLKNGKSRYEAGQLPSNY